MTPRPRISIAALLGFVGVAAVGFAAIRGATPAWAGLIQSVMFFAMFGSLLGIAFRREAKRVFWIGFALLGWGYVALSFTSLSPQVGRRLLGPALFRVIHEVLYTDESQFNGPNGPAGPGMMPGAGMGGGFRSMAAGGGGPVATVVWVPRQADLDLIGRSLEGLLWAYLGGWLARYFASGRREASPAIATPSAVPSPPATAEQAGP
jgi:hypothetical protein